MGKITKRQKYKDLFHYHYADSKKEEQVYTRNFKKRIDKVGKNIGQFKDVVEFIDVKMETAHRMSYDKDKSMDENLKEYKDQKVRQDESD